MLTSGIKFSNFKNSANNKKIKKNFDKIIKSKNKIIESLGKNYLYSFNKKQLRKYKKFSNFRLIGMGGSILVLKLFMNF